MALFSAFVVSGCSTTSHQYAGSLRSENEVATIRGVSVIERPNGKPNIVINSWKINGNIPTSDLSMTHAWAVLPGKTEVGVVLSLVTLLPMTLLRFEGTYWIPFDAEAGKTYQFYAEVTDGDLPLKVCALEVPNQMSPIGVTEGMKLPDGVKVAGCGTPRNPVKNYELRVCGGVGSCPISDATLKP